MPRRLLVTALTLTVAGCAADSTSSHVTVRDSAGIEIVEHGAGALAAAPVWTVEPQPILDLGVVEGDPAFQFFRVADGLRLDDGRLVVTNGGSGEVRMYAADGSHMRSFGGQGEGPAEFAFPYHVWRGTGDSVAIFDMGLQRISIWSADGTHGRIIRLTPSFMNEPELVGVLSNGDLLLYNIVYDLPPAGFDTMWAHIHRYDAAGEELDTIGRYPFGIMGQYEKAPRVGGPAFQPRTVVAGEGDAIVVGRGQRHELEHLDSSGSLHRIVRWHGDDLTVTAEDMDAYRADRLARTQDDNARRNMEDILASQPESKSFPAYDELVPDRADNLWVRSFSRPSYEGPARYTVFGAAGRVVARAELPADFRVFEIGEDYVLGTSADELDVEHVLLYRLRKETVE